MTVQLPSTAVFFEAEDRDPQRGKRMAYYDIFIWKRLATAQGHEAVARLLPANDGLDPDSKDSSFGHTPMVKFTKDRLDAAGIENGKGFTWAPAEYVVEAVGHCAVSQVDGELTLLWWLRGTNIYARSSICRRAGRLVRSQR